MTGDIFNYALLTFLISMFVKLMQFELYGDGVYYKVIDVLSFQESMIQFFYAFAYLCHKKSTKMRIFSFFLKICYLKLINVFNWFILNDIFYAKKNDKKIDKLCIK